MGLKSYTFVDYATQIYSALVVLLILCFHNQTVPHWTWLIAAHLLGLGIVHALIVAASPKSHPASTFSPGIPHSPLRTPYTFRLLDFFRHFYPVLLYIWFYTETGWLNRMFFQEYMDPLVIGWDQALFGFQPGVEFMHRLPYLLVSEVFYAAYFSYYLMIGGVGIALFFRNRQQFFHYVSVTSFIFYVCYLIYIVLPVIGPRVFFHEIPGYTLPETIQKLASTEVYPDTVKSGIFFRLMAFIYQVFEAPGSAIPSSHVAIALCTVYFSFRYLRPIRYIHLVMAILLCLATVYCRYHYAVDVLAGVLTAALLLPLGNRLYFHFRQPHLETSTSPQLPPAASEVTSVNR